MESTKSQQLMKLVLLDWLEELVCEFKMSSSALFVATYYHDKLQTNNLVPEYFVRPQYQLLGCAILNLANKMISDDGERPPPFWATITDHTYTEQQFCRVEWAVFHALDFNCYHPDPLWPFYSSNSKEADSHCDSHCESKEWGKDLFLYWLVHVTSKDVTKFNYPALVKQIYQETMEDLPKYLTAIKRTENGSHTSALKIKAYLKTATPTLLLERLLTAAHTPTTDTVDLFADTAMESPIKSSTKSLSAEEFFTPDTPSKKRKACLLEHTPLKKIQIKAQSV